MWNWSRSSFPFLGWDGFDIDGFDLPSFPSFSLKVPIFNSFWQKSKFTGRVWKTSMQNTTGRSCVGKHARSNKYTENTEVAWMGKEIQALKSMWGDEKKKCFPDFIFIFGKGRTKFSNFRSLWNLKTGKDDEDARRGGEIRSNSENWSGISQAL